MSSSLTAHLKWNKKMHFTGTCGSHTLSIDTNSEHGGEDLGPTPKQLVLQAMMACSAMDIVSILEKMRQPILGFEMNIEAEKNTHPPIYFKSSRLKYFLSGDIQPDKAIKALDSSLTKYCGVNYMISKAGKIFFELYLNDKLIHSGPVEFHEPLAD